MRCVRTQAQQNETTRRCGRVVDAMLSLRRAYSGRCARRRQLAANLRSLIASKSCTPPPTRLVV
jgi:hypothetical protein